MSPDRFGMPVEPIWLDKSRRGSTSSPVRELSFICSTELANDSVVRAVFGFASE